MVAYDVIVIGGGHAGIEAANAAARLGARTLLLTQNLETIGVLSCNPAIGGIAKGTVVREVDALGGVMGQAADRSMIQFRMLNRSKGPAVWSPRAQCDRGLYRRAARALLERQPNLELAQGTVSDLEIRSSRVRGVVTTEGTRLASRSVVITAGTFLRGQIHQGLKAQVPAGRAGDPPSVELSEAIVRQGVTVERFKTGTPPRIDGRSLDLERFQRQDGEVEPYWFSYFERSAHPRQVPCYLAYAGPEVKGIIVAHLHESALYGGAITGRGPRYCPSIEDKVVKFPDAERHQLFLEPEGLETAELYVNGLSTSLPPEVQLQMLQAVPGLERCRMTRAGYAIEYDYLPPTQLDTALQLRGVGGLFFAGQVNGTTGYEEAAGQGVLAGVNAALSARDDEPVVLGRDDAMIGVLIDDLVTRGTDEPYRLFTSRAEYRLLLRQDNALRRLLTVATRLGILRAEEQELAEARLEREEGARRTAELTLGLPLEVNQTLALLGVAPVRVPTRIAELVRRPGLRLQDLWRHLPGEWAAEELEWAGIELKYEGYLLREREAVARLEGLDSMVLEPELPYSTFGSLSTESRQKLARIQPGTMGRAGRIPGVSPSDLQNLALEVIKWRRGREEVPTG